MIETEKYIYTPEDYESYISNINRLTQKLVTEKEIEEKKVIELQKENNLLKKEIEENEKEIKMLEEKIAEFELNETLIDDS